ncbi:flap endonuclease GEN homolog 1 [Antennarius striatus]|uniref:flap endonuclease GEN homolog 1 n=1 Tax=Antennarius striatus TaxID=241820 RepID=UPI0035B2B0EA
MGVHDLWSILDPVRESVPVFSLGGKTLAVDLSLWVCEAQHVQALMGRVSRPHLRNLFFRVSSLTLMGVKLVFVMEGEAPPLKAETMRKRSRARYGGSGGGSAPAATSRGRFKAVLRECADMLDSLGVPWVAAAGEAEAMCAFLDQRGLVDGCITNDGDAFLYGARTVYRNFNLNGKDPQVDCYQASRVRTELQLSRDNLVGLAILLGCDYIPKGVPGVGREQALRLIQMLNGETLLQRFSRWRVEHTGVSEGAEKKVVHCQLCRHPGSAAAHGRGGCFLCGSSRSCHPHAFDYRCPCDWHRRRASALEDNVRKKTLASQQFPFTEIIREFLVPKDKPASHFRRRRPDMLSMRRFASERMEWAEHYTSEKVLVLMTYAQLINRKHGRESSSQIEPLRILKPRVRNAIACFEVVWSAPEHFVFPDAVPAAERQEVRTVEEESLFRLAYPELVERYLTDKTQGRDSKKKRRGKTETPPDPDSDGMSRLLAQMSLTGSSHAEPQTLPRPLSDPQTLPRPLSDPQTLPRPLSDPQTLPRPLSDPQALVLDAPVTHKYPQESKDPRDPPQSEAKGASPSVSAVIEALHLSDVDWDALSFTSSPNREPERTETSGSQSEGAQETPQPRAEDSAPPRPLRERLLLRNASTAGDQEQVPTRFGRDASCLVSEGSGGGKHPIIPHRPRGTNQTETGSNEAAAQTRNCCHASKEPRRHTSVRTDVSTPAVPPQRHRSDPGRHRTDAPAPPQRSVCQGGASSSEESDAENRRFGPRRNQKVRNRIRNNTSSASGFPRRPGSRPGSRPGCGPGSRPGSTRRVISMATEDDSVFLRPPASPIVLSDSDDALTCGESPLPLAERLKLKAMKRAA